jgi:hypothetical protein
MPLNNKSRLQKVQAPDPTQQQQGQTGLPADMGKRTGSFVKGMFGFYGNVMKGAAKKLKGHGQEEEAPPFG